MARPLFDVRFASSSRRLAAAIALGVGLWASTAEAHIELMTPAARYSPDQQKSEPCGAPGNPPGSGPVATYQAGETITVEFEEFVDHGGHFRIALDPTGTDAFTSPTAFDDFYNSPEVLLDEIPDMAGGVYSIEVTLPDTPCDPCTLQLIQVMQDGEFGPGTSDLYFQCSDIVIEGTGAGSTGGDTGTAGGTGGDETGSNDGAGSTGGGDTSPGGDVGSGEGGNSSGGVMDPSEGTGAGESTGSSSTTGSEEGEKGCSCRANGGSPAAVAPWLLAVLVAWRRRRG